VYLGFVGRVWSVLRFPRPFQSITHRPRFIPLRQELNLDYITANPWLVVPTSALRNINVDRVLTWLIAHAK
jgi:hypothetical protein